MEEGSENSDVTLWFICTFVSFCKHLPRTEIDRHLLLQGYFFTQTYSERISSCQGITFTIVTSFTFLA